MWKGRAQADGGIAYDQRRPTLASGKGHQRREFSGRLVADRARATAPVIMAFYHFARTADDIADHATLRRTKSWRCWTRCAPA